MAGPEVSVHIAATDVEHQRFDVILRCVGFDQDVLDLSMPAWTPGYYQLMNYAERVEDFRAEDIDGNALPWSKTSDDTWRVAARESDVVVRYRVRADKTFIAENFLDSDRAYIVPAATVMYVAGQLRLPVRVSVEPCPQWPDVVTGLESTGDSHAFRAADFDTLCDCPILMGDLQSVTFDAVGIPHAFVGYRLGEFDQHVFAHDMAKMVEAAAAIVGHVPYDRYTFIAIGPGQGGIEHANTSAITFAERTDGRSPSQDSRFMAFAAHEYFHLYNAKRIRPIALGPFDYGQANRSRMLWVAEGFTLYYEHLILKRAGLTSRQHMLEEMSKIISGHESRPGRFEQSAVDASWRTWDEGPFGGDPATTVSCYQKGAVLGLLIDLAIRHETEGTRSLDDVMRRLYQQYHQQQNRGYTEQEFYEACQQVAGAPLTEVLGYATNAEPLDYDKYLGYAGLELRQSERDDPDATTKLRIDLIDQPTELQRKILEDWMGESGAE